MLEVFSFQWLSLKWQNSKDSIEPLHSISYLYELKASLLPFTIKEPKIVSECNLFFREQLNSLLKTYNIFYRNQKNLHILYGQVSSSKKCNTAWKWKSLSPTLCDYSPWNFPGQNTGVGNLSFSRGSSWPRNQTGVSCIAGRFFASWATREIPKLQVFWG